MLKIIDRKIVSGAIAIMLVAAYAYYFIIRVPFSAYSIAALILFGTGVIIAFTNLAAVYKLLFLALPFSLEMPLGIGDSKIMIPSELLLIILANSFIAGIL